MQDQPQNLLPVPVTNLELTAETSDEMQACQESLIEWAKRKIDSLRFDSIELEEAVAQAIRNKWSVTTLRRHAKLARDRISFYEKMLSALEHGYQVVPGFPVTVFAVRSDRKKPLKLATPKHWEQHTQIAQGLPAGEGEYRNPFPEVWYLEIDPKTETKAAVREYYAKAWKDLEFPISMSKVRIMEATTRAMALKIFDDFGILPEQKKPDPLIVGRLKIPGKFNAYPEFLNFIIVWHLDTRRL